jgi:hypothetical protein
MYSCSALYAEAMHVSQVANFARIASHVIGLVIVHDADMAMYDYLHDVDYILTHVPPSATHSQVASQGTGVVKVILADTAMHGVFVDIYTHHIRPCPSPSSSLPIPAVA